MNRRKPIRYTIRFKIMVLALLLAWLPILVIGVLGFNGLMRTRATAEQTGPVAIRARAEEELLRRVIDRARIYDAEFVMVEQQVRAVADYARVLFDTPAPASSERVWISPDGPTAANQQQYQQSVAQAQQFIPFLRSMVRQNQLVSLGFIGLEDGGIAAFDADITDKLLAVRPFDVRTRPWYQAAQNSGQISWVRPYIDANTGQLVTTCSTPLYTSQGAFVGVVGFDVLLTTIRNDIMAEGAATNTYSILLDDQGNVLARPDISADSPAWLQPFTVDNLLESGDTALARITGDVLSDNAAVAQFTAAGESLFLAYAPVPQANLHMVVVQTEAEVVRPATLVREQIAIQQSQIRNQSIWLLLICLVTVPVAAALFSKVLAGPISALTAGAQRVAEGDLSHKLAITSNDEIGDLVQSFNQMTDALRLKVAELEANIGQLATLNHVSNRFRTTLSLNDLLPAIPRAICHDLGFDRASLYLRDREQLHLVSVAFANQPPEEERAFLDAVGKHPLRLDDHSVEADVIRSGQAVIVDNPWHHPRVVKFKQQLTRSESYVQVPIFGKNDQVIGLLSADYYQRQGMSVTPNDAARLLTFASMVGLTIENTRLYSDLEQQVARRTDELRIALERAREADKLKGQFLASISHELRTPLNAILGFSTIMIDEMDGPITPMQREDLRTIHQNGRYLLSMIDDLLDLARIEAGRLDLEREPVDIVALARNVVETTQGLVVGRPVTLHVEAPTSVPAAYADAAKTRQILLNLLSNAAKFTEQGYITVHIRPSVLSNGAADDLTEPVSMLRISVRDTGIGIPPEELSSVFDEFRQVHGRRSGAAGSGLGLAIARRLVEAHGGQIWAESVVNQGSTFTFTLPTTITASARQQRQPISV